MEPQEKPYFQEVVVVEGLHDAQAVSIAVDADVWVIGGDRVARRFLMELSRAAKHRGVIVFTDPDGPGERIRQRIAREIPDAKHAFISKDVALGDGKVGVEHASPEDIRASLLAAKPTVTQGRQTPLYSVSDLLDTGLLGTESAAANRQRVGNHLGIGAGNAKRFLQKINALGITRDEWLDALEQVEATKQRRP